MWLQWCIYTCECNYNQAQQQLEWQQTIEKNKISKSCAPFTNCISEINNTQIDNVKDIDIVMGMYNLIEYSDNYSKTSGSLWHYYRD